MHIQPFFITLGLKDLFYFNTVLGEGHFHPFIFFIFQYFHFSLSPLYLFYSSLSLLNEGKKHTHTQNIIPN